MRSELILRCKRHARRKNYNMDGGGSHHHAKPVEDEGGRRQPIGFDPSDRSIRSRNSGVERDACGDQPHENQVHNLCMCNGAPNRRLKTTKPRAKKNYNDGGGKFIMS
ncbi:unnamed protein product [Soboliphyme baturini]|uniref:Uncharacterized protein n=1 Tax=Soboliphyme baturini TaxID=241478 RepID=A0A183INR1_9BILA|nr:unnamed protein product [Soboliphyme baturini]